MGEPREAQRVKVEEMVINTERSKEDNPTKSSGDDPNLLKSAGNSPNLPSQLEANEGLQAAITMGYKADPVLSKVHM